MLSLHDRMCREIAPSGPDDSISMLAPGALERLARSVGVTPFLAAFDLRRLEAKLARRSINEQLAHAGAVQRVPFTSKDVAMLAPHIPMLQASLMKMALDAEAGGLDAAAYIVALFCPEKFAHGKRAGQKSNAVSTIILAVAYWEKLNEGMSKTVAAEAAAAMLGLAGSGRHACQKAYNRLASAFTKAATATGRSQNDARADTAAFITSFRPAIDEARREHEHTRQNLIEARRRARFVQPIRARDDE